jgi:hypothetical protein
MAKDPASVAQKWSDRLAGATQAYKDGITNTDVNPMERAAAAAGFWAQRVAEAATNGKFAAGLRRVSKADWQAAATGLGAQRLAQGAREKKGKMQDFLTQLLPYTDNVKKTIAAMPRGGEAESDARMLAASRMMRAFKRSR